MKKAQHTPGPWVAKHGRSIVHIHGTDGYIASVDTTNHDGMVPFHGVAERTKANAALIAAAPDLLAALEDCEAYYRKMGGPKSQWDKARAAITKARGE